MLIRYRFLLVRYQLDRILREDDPQDALNTLENLPTDLSDAYAGIIERIQANNALDLAFRVFSWLYYTQKPFRMGELIEVLSFQKGNKELNPKLFISEKVLLRRCEGLVLYDHMSDEMRFAHFTVFEYIRNHHVQNLLKSIELSKVCLRYLMMSAERFQDPSGTVERGQFIALKFIKRAFSSWAMWAREEGENDVGLWELLIQYHESPETLLRLHWIYPSLMGDLYRRFWKCSNSGCQGWSILQFLVLSGCTKMCETLFDIGCDSNLPTIPATLGQCISSLAQFCKSNLDRKCEVQGTALHFAAQEHDDLFRLLVHHGANVNETDSRGDTPIHIAAARGSVSKLSVLCTAGVDLSSVDNLLFHAALSRSHDCVQFLLGKGCPIECSESNSNNSAAHIAASGPLETFKLLVKAAPHLVNQQNIGGIAPLHFASVQNDHRNLEFLLSIPDIELSVQNGRGDTPLHYAASVGNIQTTMLLLDAGANPDLKNSQGDTPLETALLSANTQVAHALFSRVEGSKTASELKSPVSQRQWLLSMLLPRIERNPKAYRYYIAVGRIYAEDGNLELAGQYFDQSVHVLMMSEGELGHTNGNEISFWCRECLTSNDVPRCARYHCLTCPDDPPGHNICEPCFQFMQTYPPKFFNDHTFHRIPSKTYPSSISAFIARH